MPSTVTFRDERMADAPTKMLRRCWADADRDQPSVHDAPSLYDSRCKTRVPASPDHIGLCALHLWRLKAGRSR